VKSFKYLGTHLQNLRIALTILVKERAIDTSKTTHDIRNPNFLMLK
jgi:hypothetical protein